MNRFMKVMLTVILAIAFVAAEVPSLPHVSPLTGLGCPLCVRTGNIYCSNAAFYSHVLWSTVTEEMCCSSLAKADCPSYFDASDNPKTTLNCISTATFKQQSILACPQDKAVCGGQTTNIETFKDKSAPAVSR